MELKQKFVGIVAALALTFTVVGGAAAETIPGDVDLNPSDCSIVFGEGDFNFGQWNWDGPNNKYQLAVEGSNVSKVPFTVYYPAPQGGICKFTATTTGLFRTGSTTPLNDFSHNPISSWALIPMGTSQNVLGLGPSGHDSWRIQLNSVPNSYATGNYKGTFNFQVSNPALP